MNCFMGLDIGSLNSRGVLMDGQGILASCMIPSGVDYRGTARNIRQTLLEKAPGNEPLSIAATGCGADNVDFADLKVTDTQAAARGIFHLHDEVRTVVDVGSGASRVIRLGPGGQVINFSMNNRCAAGGGVFLQVIAKVLRLGLDEIGPLAEKATAPIRFNTGCAVFGETEAITRICEGVKVEDILAGAHNSLAEKIASMVNGVGLEEAFSVVGGGGMNPGLVTAIGQRLGTRVVAPSKPEMVNALGAAVMASRKAAA